VVVPADVVRPLMACLAARTEEHDAELRPAPEPRKLVASEGAAPLARRAWAAERMVEVEPPTSAQVPRPFLQPELVAPAEAERPAPETVGMSGFRVVTLLGSRLSQSRPQSARVARVARVTRVARVARVTPVASVASVLTAWAVPLAVPLVAWRAVM
jgi:hypothetical protein